MHVRTGAYGVVVDERGRLLLVHWAEGGGSGWTLPGGGLEHDELPEAAVVREIAEETGYVVGVEAALGVNVEVVARDKLIRPLDGDLYLRQHIFRVRILGGALRDETNGTTDAARWVEATDVDTLLRVPLVDVGRRLAGLV